MQKDFESSVPQNFQEIPFSPARQKLEYCLKTMPKGYGFCGINTCEIEKFDLFARQCRAKRRRPPSLYAYVARCLGATLAPQPELLAIRWKKRVYVPSRIDVMAIMEANLGDGSTIPVSVQLKDVGARSLDSIADELKLKARQAKRVQHGAPPQNRRLSPSWAPSWWRNSVETARVNRPNHRRNVALQAASVQLSSTSQWTKGHPGWGIQLYTASALSVTLAGVSRRAIVVGDEILPRLCLDIAVHFDHLITDGAPATRFIAALVDEIESGRLLNEYSISPRAARTKSADSLSSSMSELPRSPLSLSPLPSRDSREELLTS